MTVKFLLAYSTKPIQLFGKWGIYTLFAGFLSGSATIYMKIFENTSMNRNPLLILPPSFCSWAFSSSFSAFWAN